MGQSVTYNCIAYVTGESAPQGQLNASEKFFELVAGTYCQDPAWGPKVSGHAQAMQQIDLKGVRDRSAIVAKNAEDIRNIQRQGYENRQQSLDRISEQRSQTTRGVETYRNPSTGETVLVAEFDGLAVTQKSPGPTQFWRKSPAICGSGAERATTHRATSDTHWKPDR
jgi:hypothetical protein